MGKYHPGSPFYHKDRLMENVALFCYGSVFTGLTKQFDKLDLVHNFWYILFSTPVTVTFFLLVLMVWTHACGLKSFQKGKEKTEAQALNT